ncbi:MAG: phage Gp37/Gp68 family protein [bacterium]|jgi:protein gp37
MPTQIEWADEVWNPVTGCSPVSKGCENFRVTLHEDRLYEPLKWKKPRRIVCSMGDLFHPDVPAGYITAIYDVMEHASQHTFIVLTKRPGRIISVLYREEGRWHYGGGDFLPNVWHLVTAENQEMANKRIPELLMLREYSAGWRVLGVSVEPMLGPIALNAICAVVDGFAQRVKTLLDGIDWVICGGETGPNARSMHPDWVRSLRDQCVEAGVPFFFKQWGEWLPDDQVKEPLIVKMGHPGAPKWAINKLVCNLSPGLHAFKVGKKAAGRLLDGREWNEYPIREKIEP